MNLLESPLAIDGFLIRRCPEWAPRRNGSDTREQTSGRGGARLRPAKVVTIFTLVLVVLRSFVTDFGVLPPPFLTSFAPPAVEKIRQICQNMPKICQNMAKFP